MIRKHPVLLIFLLLIVGGVTAGILYARRPKPIPVLTTKVERVEKLTSLVSASGEITAHDMVDIQAEVPGVIVEMPVIEGQKVKKGDLLLKLEPFQAEMEVKTQEGRYASAESDVSRARQDIFTAESNLKRQKEMLRTTQSDLEQAEITLERDRSSLGRYETLRVKNVISQDEYEVVESKARISTKRVESAKSAILQVQDQIHAQELAVEQAKTELIQAQHNLAVADAAKRRAMDQFSKTVINSPIDGVIVRNNVDIGERAVPGIQSNPQATLMTIANMNDIEAELRVNESDIVRVKLGQKAKLSADAMPDVTTITAHVTEISAAPIEANSRSMSTQGNQEGKDFKVVLKVENPPEALRIGMLAEAEITIETRQNVLSIPIAAVCTCTGEADAKGNYVPPPKPVPGQAAGKTAMAEASGAKGKSGKDKAARKDFQGVYVKGPDGMAHFRVIKTGIMGDMDEEVLDGLKEGEEVITGPLTSLRMMEEWALVREQTATEKMSGEKKM